MAQGIARRRNLAKLQGSVMFKIIGIIVLVIFLVGLFVILGLGKLIF